MSFEVTHPTSEQVHKLAIDMSIVFFMSSIYSEFGPKTQRVQFKYNESSIIHEGDQIFCSVDIAIPYKISFSEDEGLLTDEELVEIMSEDINLAQQGLMWVYASRLARKNTPEFKKKLHAFVRSGNRLKFISDSLTNAGVPVTIRELARIFA